MADIGKIEYRVKKTTRYIVTRYHESAERTTGGTETRGEYDNGEVAFEVAYALCRAEHERLGFQPGDERIVYPTRPQADCAPVSGRIGSGGVDAFPPITARAVGGSLKAHNI